MKIYKRLSRKLKDNIESIIDKHEYWRQAYFWSPPATASQRRAKEFSNSLHFEYKGIVYNIEQSLQCSVRNYYYKCSIIKNGKKSNIKALYKLLGL